MDVYLLFGLILLAVMIASVVVVGAADRRSRNLAEADARLRRSSDALRELDEIIDGVGTLALPEEFRAIVRQRRAALCNLIEAGLVPPVPAALETTSPVTAAGSQIALTNYLSDLQRARRYLRDLERAGLLTNSERQPLMQKLSALSASIQAESFVSWSQLPGADANAIDAYLRDAQEVLSKSLNLDRAFASRVAELKERQEARARERLQRAQEEAETRAACERVQRAAEAANGNRGFNSAIERS